MSKKKNDEKKEKKVAKKTVESVLNKALHDVAKEEEKKVKKVKVEKAPTNSNIPVPVEEKKERKKRISKYDPARVAEKFKKAIESGKLDEFFK
jgi:hypothetical protein